MLIQGGLVVGWVFRCWPLVSNVMAARRQPGLRKVIATGFARDGRDGVQTCRTPIIPARMTCAPISCVHAVHSCRTHFWGLLRPERLP